jgi:hypothetical protein
MQSYEDAIDTKLEVKSVSMKGSDEEQKPSTGETAEES